MNAYSEETWMQVTAGLAAIAAELIPYKVLVNRIREAALADNAPLSAEGRELMLGMADDIEEEYGGDK